MPFGISLSSRMTISFGVEKMVVGRLEVVPNILSKICVAMEGELSLGL